LRILFLRTDPDLADNCIHELARAGFDPGRGAAGRAEELAALLERESYDVVLTEYAAPGWSWRAGLAALRELPEPIPLLVLAREADAGVLMNCVLEAPPIAFASTKSSAFRFPSVMPSNCVRRAASRANGR